MPSCAVCFVPTDLKCSKCQQVAYCATPENPHQLALWKSHSVVCRSGGENALLPDLTESEGKVIQKYLWNSFELPKMTEEDLKKPKPLSTFINSHLNENVITKPHLLALYRDHLSSVVPPVFIAATTMHPSLFPYYQLASLQVKAQPIPHEVKNEFYKIAINFYALQYGQGVFGVERKDLDSQLMKLDEILMKMEKDNVKGCALFRCFLDHVKKMEAILREQMDEIIDEKGFEVKNDEELERYHKIMRTFGNVLSL